jgi:hypothetical protein
MSVMLREQDNRQISMEFVSIEELVPGSLAAQIDKVMIRIYRGESKTLLRRGRLQLIH